MTASVLKVSNFVVLFYKMSFGKFVRHLSEIRTSLVRHLFGTCPTLVRDLSRICSVLVRHSSDQCPILVRPLSDTRPTNCPYFVPPWSYIFPNASGAISSGIKVVNRRSELSERNCRDRGANAKSGSLAFLLFPPQCPHTFMMKGIRPEPFHLHRRDSLGK